MESDPRFAPKINIDKLLGFEAALFGAGAFFRGPEAPRPPVWADSYSIEKDHILRP